MTIVVFGATGKVGSRVVKELLKRGHTVRAFVYENTLDIDKNVGIIKGDATKKEDVSKALEGHVDVVVSCLGSWGTKNKNVLSETMRSLVPLMEERGIKRIVSLTGNAARLPNENLPLVLSLSRIVLKFFQGKILKDGEEHLRILSKSSLSWTVVRSGVMLSGKNDIYKLNDTSAPFVINRSAIVKAMTDLAETEEWIRKAPFILNV